MCRLKKLYTQLVINNKHKRPIYCQVTQWGKYTIKLLSPNKIMRLINIKNGFIYPIFNLIIHILFYFNLVEFFKKIAKEITKRCKKRELGKDEKITVCNIAIDIYQIFKWTLLFILWHYKIDNWVSLTIIYYLIISNLFTYFYYHVWGSRYEQREDRQTLNRKFLNALLAISYYLVCYAYLYSTHYYGQIHWPNDIVDTTNAIYLSIANAFTLTYGGFSPLTQEIRIVFMTQLINTFLFFTIIISNSIPNHAGEKNNEL